MAFYEYIHKLRFVITGSLVVVGAFLLCLLITFIGPKDVRAKPAAPSSTKALAAASAYNGPNAVTGGMMSAANSLSDAMGSAAHVTYSGVHSAATVVVDGGTTIARGAQNGVATVIGGAGKGVAAAGKAVGGGVGFVFGLPVNAVGFASGTPVLQSVIKPSYGEEVPLIDPGSPELLQALAAMPPSQDPHPEAGHGGHGPAWPMHGRVTASFGVPHLPYQRTHTGLDISSGQASGVTPIKPFRSGRVIEVTHIRHGYGNHVIVDHGNGLTSLYAHMASTAVHVGQEVGTDTVLGYEGSTGLSTGPHLHLEIRVNGKVADPRQFIGGNP